MNTFLILSTETLPTLENFKNHGVVIRAISAKEAFSNYCVIFREVYEGYALNIETLDVLNVDRSYLGFKETYRHRLEKLTKPVEKLKMHKYKIIPNQNKHPDLITYDFMMNYFTVESDSPVNAFRKYYERNGFAVSLDLFGYVFDTESLDLYYVSWSVDEQIGYSSFAKKLEKPKMKTYRLIPNQNNLNPSYEEMMSSEYLIEACTPKQALLIHRTFNPKVNCGMALDIGTLDLYRVLYSTSFLDDDSYSDCFVRKLKPEIKPKSMNNLSFKTLTDANNKRLPLFKNSKGLPAHSKPDGSDWSHAEWLQAVVGELGEYANIMKKVQRGDLTMEEAMPSIEKEIADVQTYFSILALRLGIDLGQVTQDKFNEVSDKVKCDVYIQNDKVVSNYEVKSKQELCDELIGIKEKAKKNHLTAKTYHKPMSFDSNQLTTMLVGAVAGYLMSPIYYYKPQMKIQLQDLGNGKVYSKTKECAKRTFSMLGPSHLKEMGSEIVKGTLTKILLNGKEYEPKNVVKVGDLIQFSDERNILYSLRITELIVS